MRILNVRVARSVWLIDARDLNPRGLEIEQVMAAVKDRYSFHVYPTTIEEMDETTTKGVVFKHGSFVFEDSLYSIASATIFSDGIVVEGAHSTDLSDSFLEDVLGFLSEEFAITFHPKMVHKRLYASELIVECEKDLGGLFAPLAAVEESLSLLTGRVFQPTGFTLSTDSQGVAGSPLPFRFEREVNKSFDQRRYYSSAPLRTSDHEALLQQLETLF